MEPDPRQAGTKQGDKPQAGGSAERGKGMESYHDLLVFLKSALSADGLGARRGNRATAIRARRAVPVRLSQNADGPPVFSKVLSTS